MEDRTSISSVGSESFIEDASTKHQEQLDQVRKLVNAGVQLQQTDPSKAKSVFAEANTILTASLKEFDQDPREGAKIINKKMRRYVQLIARQTGGEFDGGGDTLSQNSKENYLNYSDLPSDCICIYDYIVNHPQYGNIMEKLQNHYGFQEDNIKNQLEHVILLLTNCMLQLDEIDDTNGTQSKESFEDFRKKGAINFHEKVFANYRSWCKWVKETPRFSNDPTIDVLLLFSIWGEAANFRQTPELLCFLFHKLSTKLQSALNSSERKDPGEFLNTVISPIYKWASDENQKKDSNGNRAEHVSIRNYDDLNEFFWNKKCLNYDETNITDALNDVNKNGKPKVAKKTFMERRSWFRAIWSMRRILRFNCALFLFLFGYAYAMVTTCPSDTIFYKFSGQDGLNFSSYEFWNSKENPLPPPQRLQEPPEKQECNNEELMICLGLDVSNPESESYFKPIPENFVELHRIISFKECKKQNNPCGCYLDTINNCFQDRSFISGKLKEKTSIKDGEVYQSRTEYNQKFCKPQWKQRAIDIITKQGQGFLNCGQCNSYIPPIGSLLSSSSNLGFFAGAGALGLVIGLEIFGRMFGAVGAVYVGRKMHVPFSDYLKYTFFWILTILLKSYVSYKLMIRPLVRATVFIWSFPTRLVLPYYHFMFRESFGNMIYILALWTPSWIVFMYDFQLWYAIMSLLQGAFTGFNKKIGEIRSFELLRAQFRNIPEHFNYKCVAGMAVEDPSKKKKKKKDEKEDIQGRTFRTLTMSSGERPLLIKSGKYTSAYNSSEKEGILGGERSSNQSVEPEGSSGITGSEFSATFSFAMAWNVTLKSMRDADIISNREQTVLSFLIDSSESETRRIYSPAFLTAGKLDESISIILECNELYMTLKDTKKTKAIGKVETKLKNRLSKDPLRVEALSSSYYATITAMKIILGPEHLNDLRQIFSFIEEQILNETALQGLNVGCLPSLRSHAVDLILSIKSLYSFSSTPLEQRGPAYSRGVYNVVDKAETVLNTLKKLVSKQEELIVLLDQTQAKDVSFFSPPEDSVNYVQDQIEKCITDNTVKTLCSRTVDLLTVNNIDAEPRSEEGRRRLRFFVNSLFMDMPAARSIRKMHSLSIATPYYSEIVMYSAKELMESNDDHVNTLFYLQTVYPEEWANFLERMEVSDGPTAIKEHELETRLWASYRGQTLARTVRGMMYMEDAVRFLYWLEMGEECDSVEILDKTLRDMVSTKFSYVCTCQIYGKQKQKSDQRALDIEFLMHKHRHFRVAYVDEKPPRDCFAARFYSVLLKSNGDSISEVYRVELPGNPILGEGKPENQNHAIIFSRGEFIQCVDMNQDGYFEECLKMPNLLHTTDFFPSKNQVTIIGFREHVFTGAVSNLAEFMSIQELAFVSLGQRILALHHARQHYGHPDIFDKVFAIGNGGTAKSSKGINLSEDIFAGFNTTLRGGRVTHEEFIQVGKGRDVGMQQLSLFEAKLASGAGEVVISRDLCRIANVLDFYRLQTFFYGNIGWYFTQTITVFAVYIYLYGRLYISLSGIERIFLQYGQDSIASIMNTEWAFQFGFLLALPIIAVIGVERGFRHGFRYLLWDVITLGPIYFTFQMGTKMHYYDRTLVHGGAKYRATGRGFTLKHIEFPELFRFYASSHMYRGVELIFLLILYRAYITLSWCNCDWTVDRPFFGGIEPTFKTWEKRCYEAWYQQCISPTNQNYGLMTFSLWIIAITWTWAPFIFNPSGFEWSKLYKGYLNWENWMSNQAEGTQDSWIGWWLQEHEYLQNSGRWGRFTVLLRSSRFLWLAWAIWYQVAYDVADSLELDIYDPLTRYKVKPTMNIYGYFFLGGLFSLVLLVVLFGYWSSRIMKKWTYNQRGVRKLKFYTFALVLILLIVLMIGIDVGLNVIMILEVIICLLLILYFALMYWIVKGRANHILVRSIAMGYDRVIGWIILLPILFISMFLSILSDFQKRIMFNADFTSTLEVAKVVRNQHVKRELGILDIEVSRKRRKRKSKHH